MKKTSSYILFAVVAVIIWIIAMVIGLFFWSFGTAVTFGMAISLLYSIAIFSYNFIKGNRLNAIAGGVFGLLLAMIVLFFSNFVKEKNWADKSIVIDAAGNIRIGYAATVDIDQVDNQTVSEILTQAVEIIHTQNVSEIVEQNVSTIHTQNVSEVVEQNVSTIHTQNVSEIVEQNVSTIHTQNVSEIVEQNVSTIHTQNVSEIVEEKTTVPTSKKPETTTTVTTQHTCSWNLTDSKQPTCMNDGYEKYSCSCGKTYNKTLNALGHSFSEWRTVEATCEQSGYKVRSCTRCGHEEKTTINAKGHSWDSGMITVQPTCNQTGVKTYTCRNCGKTKQENVPMTSHQFGIWQHDEYNHWHECSVCRTRQDQATHNWDAGTVTTQPTEYSEGVKTYRCSVCNRTKTEVVPKLQPSKPAVVEVQATFGSPNYSYGSTVTVTVRFKNVSSVPSSVLSTSLGRLEVVTQGVNGSDYVIVYNVTGITEANVGSSIFLSLASGYEFISDPVCTITE